MDIANHALFLGTGDLIARLMAHRSHEFRTVLHLSSEGAWARVDGKLTLYKDSNEAFDKVLNQHKEAVTASSSAPKILIVCRDANVIKSSQLKGRFSFRRHWNLVTWFDVPLETFPGSLKPGCQMVAPHDYDGPEKVYRLPKNPKLFS